MKTVNVRQLKNNPSEALRDAAVEPVLVLKGDEPAALLVGIGPGATADADIARVALAVLLYREGTLGLGRAARVASMTTSEFVTRLSELGVAVGSGDADEVTRDLETLDAWLASS